MTFWFLLFHFNIYYLFIALCCYTHTNKFNENITSVLEMYYERIFNDLNSVNIECADNDAQARTRRGREYRVSWNFTPSWMSLQPSMYYISTHEFISHIKRIIIAYIYMHFLFPQPNIHSVNLIEPRMTDPFFH